MRLLSLHKAARYLTIVCTFLSGAAYAQLQFPVQRPVLKPTDQWAYQMFDLRRDIQPPGVTAQQVLRVGEQSYRMQIQSREGQRSEHDANFDLNGFWRPIDGKPQVAQFYRFPLSLNKTWTYQFKRQYTAGVITTYEASAVVDLQEKAIVPAGTFDTVRIVIRSRFKNSDGKTGKDETMIWYAPAVKRHVRWRYTWWLEGELKDQVLDELVSYQLN